MEFTLAMRDNVGWRPHSYSMTYDMFGMPFLNPFLNTTLELLTLMKYKVFGENDLNYTPLQSSQLLI